MKSRLILLAITFAILALAGIACDDARSFAPQSSAGAATTFAPQQTPTPELPVIVRAAATAPASAQTILDFAPPRNIHKPLNISTQTQNTSVEQNQNAATPQSIPLLI